MEIILNCDIIIAGEDVKLALPEVKRGVVASQGGMLGPKVRGNEANFEKTQVCQG